MPDEDTAIDAKGTEEEAAVAVDAEAEVWPGVQTSLGWWDGTRFYMRNFAVWYRWTQCPSTFNDDYFLKKRPEEGISDGVSFIQSMGRIQLTYDLIGPAEQQLKDTDISVEMSCWQINVMKGSSQNTKNLPKIGPLCGELCRDIRRDLSWWEIVEDDPYWPGRHLVISLAKLDHKAWSGIWYKDTMNHHRKAAFGWTAGTPTPKEAKALQSEEETLAIVPPGAPQELEKELCTATPPEKLCTGTDFKEDAATITFLLYLDEDELELAATKCPYEEIFSADVEEQFLEVSLRGDGFGLCWGELAGPVIPELSVWEIAPCRIWDKKVLKEAGIKDPAFITKTLRITMTKARPGDWGKVFTKMESPTFAKPKEVMPWTEKVQRALVLSPVQPMNAKAKAERALKLCTQIETSQDNVLHRVFITFHLEERLEVDATRLKMDLDKCFSVRISDAIILEINFCADNEWSMSMGKLGGNVIREKTTWELTKVGDSHLAIKIALTKARDSQVPWDEVYTKVKPWELVDHEYNKLQALDA
jgi:hypothetical protein